MEEIRSDAETKELNSKEYLQLSNCPEVFRTHFEKACQVCFQQFLTGLLCMFTTRSQRINYNIRHLRYTQT